MPRGTTLRNVRVADPLWSAARAVAEDRGENLSDVIRDALERYASDVPEQSIEYAVEFPSDSKRGIEVVPGEKFGRRLVRNDPRRRMLRRTVTPWEFMPPPPEQS